MTKQIADELFSICVGCCGLHGQVKDCAMPADASQCPQCAANLLASRCSKCGLATFPGCRACGASGHTHEKDTRSWHTMHSNVINDETKRTASVQWKHETVAANHEAALQAEQKLAILVGLPVQSDAQPISQVQ